MEQSIYKKLKNVELKKKALKIYKQGLGTREVGKIIGKSHNWVAEAIKELTKNEK